MNARETLDAARALWDKQNDQLSFDALTERDPCGVAQVPGEIGRSLSQSTGLEPRRTEYAGVVAPPAGRHPDRGVATSAVDGSRSVSMSTFETSPPAGNYGSPDALDATLQARGVNPGASTHPASTDGSLSPQVADCHVPTCEERDAGLNQTADGRSHPHASAAVGMEVTA